MGIYLNTNINDFKQTCLQAAGKYRTISFGRGGFDLSPNKFNELTSVGVFMLTAKCIKLAKRLRNEGKNVFLVIDNIHEILAN